MASDAVAPDAADSVTDPSTVGDEAATRSPASGEEAARRRPEEGGDEAARAPRDGDVSRDSRGDEVTRGPRGDDVAQDPRDAVRDSHGDDAAEGPRGDEAAQAPRDGDETAARPRAGSGAGRRPRRDARRIAARGVLGLLLLLTGLLLAIIVGCFINDRTIEESRGQAVAEVVDSSFTRTVVRFSTDEGRVYIPPAGVLYPSGLQQGQLVRVEYDTRNPDLVRVAGRTMVLSLLPVGTAIAGTWLVLLPTYLVLRRRRA
ncbi:DUF3592 domain-containing protein [Saccharopolyspora erythraea]|uniref:DUF3592 domain-containing protein n=1 Tax=Saccharopolyspora erythraea TaxID=1836 RepID=UPI0003264B85|nr:DUF3592 domain-containing protein [Saccharopolyspora erythraea]EQD86960.1 hypothetical protein N599_07205 [Saccharopolyspora erythraea D]